VRAAQAVLRLMRTELIAAYGRWCMRVSECVRVCVSFCVFMCMCMCVCVCVCLHVYIRACIHQFVYVYACVWVYMFLFWCVCLCVRVYVRHTVCTYSPDPYLRVEHVYIWKLHLCKKCTYEQIVEDLVL